MFEVGVQREAGFADVNALLGADERAGWMWTEVEHAEPEAGFGAGLGSEQAAIGVFAGRLGCDCGFGVVVVVGVVGNAAGARHAW